MSALLTTALRPCPRKIIFRYILTSFFGIFLAGYVQLDDVKPVRCFADFLSHSKAPVIFISQAKTVNSKLVFC